jgi:hypothetical protein
MECRWLELIRQGCWEPIRGTVEYAESDWVGVRALRVRLIY